MSRKRVNRLGCGCLLVGWFAFLIIVPCGVINLVVNNEIVITKSGVPDDQLRIWLINSTDNRGIGFANGYITQTNGSQVCTQTDLRFLLWKGTPPDKTKSCTCYQKQGESYAATSMDDGTCMVMK